MRDFYLHNNFFKTTLDEAAQYSDVPDGDLDIDRLASSKPAFLESSDIDVLKPRKCMLGVLDEPQELNITQLFSWKLNILMALRQIIADGFEIYQCRQNDIVLLTNLSLGEIFFLTNKDQLSEKKIALEILSVTKGDFFILDQKLISDFLTSFPIEKKTLWQSDFLEFRCGLCSVQSFFGIEPFQLLKDLGVRQLILNMHQKLFSSDIEKNLNGIEIKSIISTATYHEIPVNADLSQIEKISIGEIDKNIYVSLGKMKLLREVNIKEHAEIDIGKLVNIDFKILEILTIDNNKISSADIKKLLKKNPNLKKFQCRNEQLDLRGMNLTEREFMLLLGGFTPLKKLSIDENEEFFLNQKGGFFPFPQFLEELTLGEVKSDEVILFFLKKCPNLKKLNFSKKEINLSGFEAIEVNKLKLIFEGNHDLKKLYIKNLYKISESLKCLNFYVDEITIHENIFYLKDIMFLEKKIKKANFNLKFIDFEDLFSLWTESQYKLIIENNGICENFTIEHFKCIFLFP